MRSVNTRNPNRDVRSGSHEPPAPNFVARSASAQFWPTGPSWSDATLQEFDHGREERDEEQENVALDLEQEKEMRNASAG
jgi:hypothetical protein